MKGNLDSDICFKSGSIIIVDPDQPVKNGNSVIASAPKMKEATFKQYFVDSGVKYLKALNLQYPIVEMKESTQICGVVVACLQILN